MKIITNNVVAGSVILGINTFPSSTARTRTNVKAALLAALLMAKPGSIARIADLHISSMLA